MPTARRDDNYIPALLAETNNAARTPTPLKVDPVTKRLLVDLDSGGGGGTAVALPVFLVASSTASAEEQALADYLADGTADQVQIQAAIDAAIAAGGGVVELTDGDFSISAGISWAAHSIRLRGQGPGITGLIATAATFNVITVGNRQSDGVMRNFNSVSDMTVTHAGGASSFACIKVDGGGRGSYLSNIETNEGSIGLHLMDLDRYSVINCDINNVRNTAILLQVGVEGTFGKVDVTNCSTNLSDASSIGVRLDTTGSTNPFDAVAFRRCLFFSTSNVAGTIGVQFNLGGVDILFDTCQFESPSASHVEINDETRATFIACSFIQNGTLATTSGFRLVNDNHALTIISCVFQKIVTVFNSISGSPIVDFLGYTKNNGNITNVFAGSFGIRHGTDTAFAGNGAMYLGTDNERYESVFTNQLRINNFSPTAGKVWKATDSSGNGAWAALPGQLYLSAAGMWPSTTSGMAAAALVESTTNKLNTYFMDASDSASKLYAECTVAMPSDWDGGTFTAQFYWLAAGTSTTSVVWGLQGRSFGDLETLDQAFGTAGEATDAHSATANQVQISAATSAITVAGTPAAGELVQFRAYRDSANASDTFAATARLLGIMINYTKV